jgi:hypothetical protein
MTNSRQVPIGIDFGTTNTTLVYSNGAELKTFEMRGASKHHCIPTVVAYPKNPDARNGAHGLSAPIGENALKEFRSGDVYLCRHFKLLLGAEHAGVLTRELDHANFGEYSAQYAGAGKSPSEVAHDFFYSLFEAFISEIRINGQELTLDQLNIALTVPVDWMEFELREKRDMRGNPLVVLREVFSKLGFEENNRAPNSTSGTFRFEREPVAAAAYFAYEYHRENTQHPVRGYEGYVLVVDWGGGTLDLTLAQVKHGEQGTGYIPNITPIAFGAGDSDLDQLGRVQASTATKRLGVGGVAFDKQLLNIALEEAKMQQQTDGTPLPQPTETEVLRILVDLEADKVNNHYTVSKILRRFVSNPDKTSEITNPILLNLKATSLVVKAHMFLEAFEASNLKALENAFSQIQRSVPAFPDSLGHPLKIVCAGGFSQFELAKVAISDIMQKSGKIIDGTTYGLSLDSAILAIARGAAMVADKTVVIENQFQYDVVLPDFMPHRTNYALKIFSAGEKLNAATGRWRYSSKEKGWTHDRGSSAPYLVDQNSDVKIFYKRASWQEHKESSILPKQAGRPKLSLLGIDWINKKQSAIAIYVSLKLDAEGKIMVRFEDAENHSFVFPFARLDELENRNFS